ncbi:androgen-dependent TFPI-regulating protein-like [Planococcus citri]|uniref:androgen-dependent TFPI-regulating protein-like n=1 Tax=Planococcus citri TaxID=170843 RepID=UPI0031FA47B0
MINCNSIDVDFYLFFSVQKLKMSINRFHKLELATVAKYMNNLRLNIVNNDQKRIALKWIRSMMTGYYLFIAYYGLFKLDFASISHPTWRNLKNHWWKCITVWNVGLQVRYFLMSFLIDHVDNLPKTSPLRRIVMFGKRVQDYCFITLDVPSSIFVCSLFWLIQTLNRPLFFPSEMSNWIPDWYNHAVHTNPFFVIFFLMFFNFHRNPPVTKAVFGLCLLSSAYIMCVLHTRWTTGQWIYMVIGELVENTPLAMFLVLLTGFIFPIFILLLCYKLNDFIWNERNFKMCN